MTDPARETASLQDESRSNSHTSWTSISANGGRHRRRGHPDSLARRLANVVDVEEPHRLMESSQIQRQARFQNLIRRYISQILYGCKSAYCTTSTCLSCKKRLVTRPFRPPTQLTARALAHFLASQHDPHSSLCPHELKVPPASVEIEGLSGLEFLEVGEGSSAELTIIHNVTQPTRPPQSGASTSGGHAQQHDGPIQPTDGLQVSKARVTTPKTVHGRHQTKKDVKSLGQNLFDTASVILSFSKQIPTPLEVFEKLRTLSPASKDDVDTPLPSNSKSRSGRQGQVEAFTLGSSAHVNGHTVTPATNGSAKLDPGDIDLHSSERMSVSGIVTEVTSNGEQLHRFRHQLPNTVVNGHAKKHEITTLDGTQEATSLTTPMRRKSLKLDLLNSTHKGRRPLAPTAIQRDGSVPETTKKNKTPKLPVASYLDCDIMDQLKEEVFNHRRQQSAEFAFAIDYDAHRSFRPSMPFVNRSLFFTLSDPETLLKSFHDTNNEAYEDSPLSHLNSTRLTHAFRDWNGRNGALIFDSLWTAARALFVPPPELDVQKSPRLKACRKTASESTPSTPASPHPDARSSRYLCDEDAAHLIMICIHALTSLISVGWPRTWIQLRSLRSWGIILPNAPPRPDRMDPTSKFVDPWISIIDEFEYEPAFRLADALVRGIGARMCFNHIQDTLDHNEAETNPGLIDIIVEHLVVVERVALSNKRKLSTDYRPLDDPGWTVTATFVEWLRTIIIKKWDGKADINRWDSAGAAMEILNAFYLRCDDLNLRRPMFQMPYLHERLDEEKAPRDFLDRERQPNSHHIFFYPFLFPSHYLVSYFRTINFTTMYNEFMATERAQELQRKMNPFLRELPLALLRNRLKVTLSDYLVLDVTRKHALEDTLDQLWGLEHRTLRKPLKVKMGTLEGEVGLDQGGVTSEFFRVVLGQAFNTDNGMFTIDPQSRMIWFQPFAIEPEWKFEMLGILFSLAVYNGITLPVTFPLALYRALLEHPPVLTPEGIRDGWPTLAKSLDQLLTWTNGDVSDVFMRNYTYSFDVYDQRVDVNIDTPGAAYQGDAPVSAGLEGLDRSKILLMEGAPSSHRRTDSRSSPGTEAMPYVDGNSDKEAQLVTNENRAQYVRDYIYWLAYRSVSAQLTAFKKGFHTCLHPKSLLLFDPPTLKTLVEGTQDIDVSALKTATRYDDGYHANHAHIEDLWSIVESYSMDDRRKFLEFVTASERVPVTGFESMNFHITRSGGDTEMLPTSSTCFGKLMLPEYSSKEKLKRKLDLAIQNSKGFGVV
ncbi:hypothetical protein BDV96DRAFT_645456 [Lophiotrema nucula]|uniref:HECT-type E3 ubiquitin transferase n=1 Tax=Lophiotrema nucula TaxID=690887 RepID=A0A6A5ZCF5_9PLEO|nr:hypothetical protein BDV96DRAFT_645456 [Lophiotrema nucula]